MTSGPPSRMPARELAIRLLTLGGLGVSTLLLVQYLSPAHSLCTHGGCASVRQSSYAGLLGIPTPVLGIAYFCGLLALSVLNSTGARRARLAVAIVGGLGAAGFVAIQAVVLEAYCEYCLAVDAIALVIAVVALSLARGPATMTSTMERNVFAGLAALSIAAGIAVPTIVGHQNAPYQFDVQSEIRDLQIPGKVTIVEFVDFGCPACRAQHAILSEVLADKGDTVAVVYKHLPLPMHRGARDAARAYLCAGTPELGHKLADLFFKAETLGPEQARAAAVAAGVAPATYDACITADATNKRLAADHDDATSMGLKGLPTFWIGDERFEGVQQAAIIRDSIKRARAR